MIQPEVLKDILLAEFPDATVMVSDRTGSMDHYQIRITSSRFEALNPMDRHRMVMAVLQPLMADNRLHAAEIQTGLPD